MVRRALVLTTAILLGWSLYLGLNTPPEEIQGEFAKMLFIHVPSVITAYVALAFGLLGGVWYLIRRSDRADRLSSSAIEIGVVFTALTLLTGMIWGRPVWGVWWDWGDARLMSTAFLFFFYLGYLALRRSITDPDLRATRSAILAIIAFAQVPIVHFSVIWFRTLHQGPTIIRADPTNAPIDPEYGRALSVTLLGFLALFSVLLLYRMHLALIEARREANSGVAGDDITPPDLGGA